MKTYFKLAWRNLWRNKKRTLITVASIFFGVLFSSIMSSMQDGTYEHMTDLAVKFYSGSIQVHKKGYWDNQKLNNAISANDSIENAIEKSGHATFYTPRLESYALASSENITKGVMVLGINPEMEDKVTKISDKLDKGSYLEQDDEGVVLTGGLASYLKLGVNDTLVMIGQGYHGVSAAGKFPVRGIIEHPNPEFNKNLVYMSLKSCQEFYSAYGLYTAYVIMVDDYNKLEQAQQEIKSKLKGYYEVMTWKEMQPVLVQQIESDKQGGVVMKGILYIVIAFGILGTIMMMMSERKREFGVLIAVGMKKYKLEIIMLIETVLIGIIGVILGIIISIPVNYILYLNPIPLTGQAAEVMNSYGFDPIMKFSMAPWVFLNQALTVFILTLVIALYPVFNISKLNIMNALRG